MKQGQFSDILSISEAKGCKEGREEGFAEGHKQMQLQIARSLKQAGLSDSEIATHTHLSLEEIKQLRQTE